MAEPMIITRGLPVPDPNFIHPIGEAWTLEGFDSADVTKRVAYKGSGSCIRVDVTGAAFDPDDHRLESSNTPYGVFGAPWSSEDDDRHASIVYGLIARTHEASGNSNDLVRMRLRALTSAGQSHDVYFETDENELVNDDDLPLTDQTEFDFYHCRRQCRISPSVYWWRLLLAFQDSSPTGASVDILWAGVGILFDHTDTYASDSTSNYIPESFGPPLTRNIWVRPQTGLQPLSSPLNRGAHSKRMSFLMSGLSDFEKAMMERAEYWNLGGPEDAVECVWNYPPTRGGRHPLFVAVRRNGVKQAFYADAEFGEMVPVHAKVANGLWPEAGNLWDQRLTLVERQT